MGSASLGSGAKSCYAPAHVTPRPGSHKSQSSCASPSARTSSRHSVQALSRSFSLVAGQYSTSIHTCGRMCVCVSTSMRQYAHMCVHECMSVFPCLHMHTCVRASKYVHLCLCTQPICNVCFLEIAVELVVRNNKLIIQHCSGDSLPMGGC